MAADPPPESPETPPGEGDRGAPRVEPDHGARSDLRRALAPLAEDHTAPAVDLVLGASQILFDCLNRRDGIEGLSPGFSWSDWGRSEALDALRQAHGWRGPVARWLATLDALAAWAPRHLAEGHSVREVLAEELGLWLGGETGAGPTQGPWDGQPLSDGRRLADRAQTARHARERLTAKERVLVHGYSHTVAAALVSAWEAGLAPEVVLSESPANLGGRRLALHLVEAGLRVRLGWDLALFGELPAADRFWIGAEAVGATGFLAPRGSRALLEEARRLGVPTAVVTTTDKIMPGGELLPPAPGEELGLLWELPPSGVELDGAAWEEVPLDLPSTFITEHGATGPADLFLSTAPLSEAHTPDTQLLLSK